MANLDKNKRIKKEIQKYRKIFRDIDEDRKKAVEKLIENVAFMTATLEDLQEEINENGYIEEYQNGEFQCGYKESAAVKVYNSLIRNYNTSIKQILDQLPDTAPANTDDFDEFLMQK